MLKRALDGVLTIEECDQLYSGFDQIGDIIVVRIPESLESKKATIGKTLLDEVRPARAVYCQSSDVGGPYRTRNLELLAGTGGTLTEYKESGCRFVVDVEKTFFSPRLSTERQRIAELVKDGETIVNMFAGVGAFSIAAAKNTACTVHSIDINPEATKLCQKNITLNKMKGTVVPIDGDAAKVISDKLHNTSDRTLMLLPERSDEFLQSAVDATKSGGVIHYYLHVHADSKSQAPKISEQHYCEVGPAESEILCSKIVRVVGPRYYQTVVDVKVHKN